MVQDLFKGETARRKQAYVSVVLTTLPMLAPALGSIILFVSSWRMIHVLMAVAGMMLAVTTRLFVTESLSARALGEARKIGFIEGFGMLRDDGFRRIAIVNALSYGSIFAYIAGAPVVLISQFHYSTAIYAAVFAGTAAALSAGAMTNARLARRFECRALVSPALVIQAIVNIGLVVGAMTTSSVAPWVLLPMLLIGCFARGIISPNLVYAALSIHRVQAGFAAALVGLLQLITAAIASALSARFLNDFGAISVAATMAALSAAALVLWQVAQVGRVVAQRN